IRRVRSENDIVVSAIASSGPIVLPPVATNLNFETHPSLDKPADSPSPSPAVLPVAPPPVHTAPTADIASPNEAGGAQGIVTPGTSTSIDNPVVARIYLRRPLHRRILLFLGIGRGASRARRSLVTLCWNLVWGITQVTIIVAICVVASKSLSPHSSPPLNEWQVCGRLGAWSCVWIARVLITTGLAVWTWQREKVARERASTDPEQNGSGVTGGGNSDNAHASSTGAAAAGAGNSQSNSTLLRHTRMYARLTMLSSLITLSWFLTAHIMIYTSLDTCYHDAPHLWWLVFGILCIMYLMVLEVAILGLIVFILAPILFLLWNILLICTGRHPLQNPGAIKPEVGKLPRSVVDCIPLVIYIPPPPDAPLQDVVKIPEVAHTYPPKLAPTAEPEKARRRRFRFLRRQRKKTAEERSASTTEKPSGATDAPAGSTWEDRWENSGLPFVILEGNRAVCAICLMDFEEPNRASHAHSGRDSYAEQDDKKPQDLLTEATEQKAPPIDESAGDQLRLEDAGDGAQPLRLLPCGHAFHKTCLDPWLLDVSGRCPVCQQPVEIPRPSKKSRRNR
ncbi:hypothetical protein FISHEDRAFT_23924, partial [Fistulina hepatica ATCC 64428]